MSREAESAELGVHLRHVEMVEEQEVKPSQASKAVESVSLPKINHRMCLHVYVCLSTSSTQDSGLVESCFICWSL